MCQCQEASINADARAKIDEIINAHKDEQGCLIPILHEIQEYYGYLPYEVQKIVAEGINVPITDVYGVITFYSRFTTKPMGKHKVGVCLGTACYVKGSDKVLEKVEEKLGIKAGETSEDGLFTIEATRCVGACGLAPVMLVGEDVYGRLVPEDVEAILEKYN